MRNPVPRSSVILLALAAGVAFAAPGRADEAPPDESPLGPALGNLTYRAAIRHGPEGADADSYAGALAAGERLSVSVTSPFQSGLLPRLEFVGPDGTARNVGVQARELGKTLFVRDWAVPETGRWTVRVSGVLDTFGSYSVQFRVRAPEPFLVEVEPDEEGILPADVVLPFDALAGSSLDLRASVEKGPAPTLVWLRDPEGADVRADGDPAAKEAVTRGHTVRLRLDSVGATEGTYTARITAPAGHGGLVATARVVAPRRPGGSRRLRRDEPYVDPRPSPLRGVFQQTVRITGRHFSISPKPKVLFGDVAGTEVAVDPYGVSLVVRPPVLPEGATVRVAVVNPDGQVAERPGYFHYVPTPEVTDLTDLAGVPVRGAGTDGGRRVRILGSNFQTGVFVRFGQSADVIPLLRSDGEMELTVPPQPEGPAEVRVLDAYAHDVLAPFPFEYKAPPDIPLPALTPDDVPGDGTSVVSIRGTGFLLSDLVLFDGAPALTFFYSPFELRFVVPQSAPGLHRVAVRDRVATEVPAGDLTVR